MFARIFKPAKTAMQSGKAKTGSWVLEFDAAAARSIDPLMGWTSSAETKPGQVRLTFENENDAVAYATKHKIAYQLVTEKKRAPVLKTYGDNFAFKRRKPWTH